MRDLPPGAVGAVENASGTDPVSGDFSDDADDTVDSPSTHDSNTAPRGAPATDIDLSPPPQNTGSISWTGLSAPEPAAGETADVEPSRSDAASNEPARREMPSVEATPTEATAPTAPPVVAPPVVAAPVAAAPVAAAEASEAPAGAEAPAEKKVVWSSSPPDRFTTFGGNTRRDDY